MKTPQFAVGQPVRVRAAFPPGHIRTPYYTRGCVGTIESLAGLDPNPEHLAYGHYDQPPVLLYRVRFRQSALWPTYRGNPQDTVVVDIFEHWLEAIDHA
jgi:nitrile hydratase subunit beta